MIIFINRELTPAALTDCVMTATEAKAAALQELGINSRYSDSPATGTGTDQILVASQLGTSPPLGYARKHTKLGELIGKNLLKGRPGDTSMAKFINAKRSMFMPS